MKHILLVLGILSLATTLNAQISKASLQASGLTCSMCSKAVKIALEKVSFVEKIDVDIKNQRYNLQFKRGAKVNLDALGKAVIDAGFSVASLKVTADLESIKAAKDAHVSIGGQNFHFLNGTGQQLNGTTTFSVVDRSFVSAKDFKKHSAATKMECIRTGKAAACCAQDDIAEGARVYHVII